MLTCQTYESNGVLVLAMEDNGVARDERQTSLREALYRAIESHPDTRYAIDLGAINYMASSDIGFLITLKRRIDARKGKLVLFAVDPYIVDALKTMKLHQFFTIVPSQAEAMAQLAAG